MSKFDNAFKSVYDDYVKVFGIDINLRKKLQIYYIDYRLKYYPLSQIKTTFYSLFTYDFEYAQRLPSYAIERCLKVIVNKIIEACDYFYIKTDKDELLKELTIYYNAGRTKVAGIYTTPSVIFQKRQITLLWLDRYLNKRYGFCYHRFIQSFGLICKLYNIKDTNVKNNMRLQFKDFILKHRSYTMDFEYFNTLILKFIQQKFYEEVDNGSN